MSYAITIDNGETSRALPAINQQTLWTDDAIVRAVAGGGVERDAALEWWFNDQGLHHWVRQYVLQHGGAATDGEDLYHDTFIAFDRLIRNNQYRGEAALRTFFCSIAKWQWLNRQRKLGRVVGLENIEQADIPFFAETDMYSQERQILMERLLESMGVKCKKLLTFFQLSYSMKEIAAEMGYASDQVAMNQCSECRKKLKQLIENNHELKDFLNI